MLEVVRKKEEALPATAEVRPKLQAAYTVGLYDSGDIDFSIGGESPGLVEILGLHTYVSKQLEALLEEKTGLGHRRTWEALQRLSLPRNSTTPNSLGKTGSDSAPAINTERKS